ncbi:MAG: dioxygenase [Burkholderiales bacterium]|nr:dioxygenase [Burkholderiales bacterium]
MTRLPTAFLSHGSPMHAIEPGVAGRAWEALGRELPRPKAILMASAHWETSLPMLSGNPMPATVHDFGGFPQELYTLRYAAPGSPGLAARAVALLKEAGLTAGVDGCRGLDHGAWVPLLHMHPGHDIPVVQISLQPALGAAHHVALGRALAPLAAEGVLVVGSGHTTHNLRDWAANRRRTEPLRYAEAFAAWVDDRLQARDTAALIDWRTQAPEALRAHPSDEHFLPLHVAWGAAGAAARAQRIVHGFEGGALALDSWLFWPQK